MDPRDASASKKPVNIVGIRVIQNRDIRQFGGSFVLYSNTFSLVTIPYMVGICSTLSSVILWGRVETDRYHHQHQHQHQHGENEVTQYAYQAIYGVHMFNVVTCDIVG